MPGRVQADLGASAGWACSIPASRRPLVGRPAPALSGRLLQRLPLPTALSSLSALTRLELENNALEVGGFPAVLATRFRLSEPGKRSMQRPSSLSNCIPLAHSLLSHFPIPFCAQVLPVPASLRALSLRDSLMFGVPSSLSQLVRLTDLIITDDGDLVEEELEVCEDDRHRFMMDHLQFLIVVYLNKSLLQVLSHLTNLERLGVSLNNRDGPLPAWMGALPRLADLDLTESNSSHRLTADTGCLGQLTALRASWHDFLDPAEQVLAGCTRLRALHLCSIWVGYTRPTGLQLASLLRMLRSLP